MNGKQPKQNEKNHVVIKPKTLSEVFDIECSTHTHIFTMEKECAICVLLAGFDRARANIPFMEFRNLKRELKVLSVCKFILIAAAVDDNARLGTLNF